MQEEKNKQVWRILGKSVIGAQHAKKGLPNQDDIFWKQKEGTGVPLVMAVADGHGSETYFRSQVGAMCGVRVAERVTAQFLRGLPDLSKLSDFSNIKYLAEQVPRNILFEWREEVEKHWQEHPPSKEEWKWLMRKENGKAWQQISMNQTLPYGATLLTVLVTKYFIFYLQLGDGDILEVSEEGKVTRPIADDERLLANETTSLCTAKISDFRSHFKRLSDTSPALILVSTDGYANSFMNEQAFLKVGSDIWSMMREGGIEKVESDLESWLTTATKTGSGDDITLGILCCMNVLEKELEVPEVEPIEPIKEEEDRTPANQQQAADAETRQQTPYQSGISISNGLSNAISTKESSTSNIDDTGKHAQPVTPTMTDKAPPNSGSGISVRQFDFVVSQDGKGDFTSISEALQMAKPFNKIAVHSGTYNERLLIDKSIDIFNAHSSEKVVIEYPSPCIDIQVNNVNLEGLTIRGKSTDSNVKGYSAIDISRGKTSLIDCDITSATSSCISIHGSTANLELQRCHIHDSQRIGVYAWDSCQSNITDCYIYDNSTEGVVIRRAKVVINNCEFYDGKGNGILVTENGRGTVNDCKLIHNARAGIVIQDGCSLDIKKCTFTDNEYGIKKSKRSNITLVENTIQTKNGVVEVQ